MNDSLKIDLLMEVQKGTFRLLRNLLDQNDAHAELLQTLFDVLNKASVYSAMNPLEHAVIQENATLAAGKLQEAQNNFHADFRNLQRQVSKIIGQH